MISKKKAILFPVLCIPVVAAIAVGIITAGDNNKPSGNKLEKIVITTADSEDYTYSDKDVLELYSKVIENSVPVETPSFSENAVRFTVNYSGASSNSDYTFIMDPQNTANCGYTNVNGESYSINKDDAYNLLLRNEFESAYAVDGISALSFTYGDTVQTVAASSYTWNYKRVDGEYNTDTAENRGTAVRIKIPKSAAYSMTYDKLPLPSSTLITVNDGSEVVYNGEFAGLQVKLAEKNYTEDKILGVKVEAKWDEVEGASSFGSAVYDFEMLYDVPATYELVDISLRLGNFTAVVVKNGNEGEVITARSDMMPGETKAFTVDGKMRIYIPISTSAAVGRHTISIIDSNGESKLYFNVSGNTYPEVPASYTVEAASKINTANQEEYDALLESVKSNGSSQRYWKDRDKFAKPVDVKASVKFGSKIAIMGMEPVYAIGDYYKAANGTGVKASNDGVIAFAGSTEYTGNAVIIDHGAGVLSYYFNLGSVSVKTGDTVKKSDAIGTVGTSGMTPFEDTFLYANSVDGYFVDPSSQILYGICLNID